MDHLITTIPTLLVGAIVGAALFAAGVRWANRRRRRERDLQLDALRLAGWRHLRAHQPQREHPVPDSERVNAARQLEAALSDAL